MVFRNPWALSSALATLLTELAFFTTIIYSRLGSPFNDGLFTLTGTFRCTHSAAALYNGFWSGANFLMQVVDQKHEIINTGLIIVL